MLDMEKSYEEYAEFVFKYLMTLCNDEITAEELTQETFFRAIKSADQYDGTCKVTTWLCQIGKHVWYQELDRRRRKTASPLEEHLPSQERTPEEVVCTNWSKMNLIKTIHTLGETQKEVVLLRITGAFSFREIGEVFGQSENWARVTYYRAKQKIMKGGSK